MKRHTLRFAHATVFTAAAAVVALMLSGCDQTLPGVSTASPQKGECHNITISNAMDATSDSSPPVPCSAPHTTETFLTGTITSEVTPLATQPFRPNQQQLKELNGKVCPPPGLRDYLGARPRDSVRGMGVVAYFPSRGDWEAGARSFRCDVVINSPEQGPVSLTRPARQVMTTAASARLRTCYLQQKNADGSYGNRAQEVDCSQPHTAEDVNAWLPMDQSVNTDAQSLARCENFVTEFFAPAHIPPGVAPVPIVVGSEPSLSLHCAVGFAPLRESQGTLAPLDASEAVHGT